MVCLDTIQVLLTQLWEVRELIDIIYVVYLYLKQNMQDICRLKYWSLMVYLSARWIKLPNMVITYVVVKRIIIPK